jgi:hypothetical protein
MAQLQVFNPVAEALTSHVDLAPRLDDMNGKRIGLYWNLKAGGDVALRKTEEELARRYPDAKFSYYTGSVGFVMRHVTPQEADRISQEVDAIVGTSSD